MGSSVWYGGIRRRMVVDMCVSYVEFLYEYIFGNDRPAQIQMATGIIKNARDLFFAVTEPSVGARQRCFSAVALLPPDH